MRYLVKMQGGRRKPRRTRKSAPRQGAKKLLADTYFADIKDAGVPQPTKEYRFHETRRWKVDAIWLGLDLNLVVEIEGGTGWQRPKVSHHITPEGYRNDCEKYNALHEWGVRTKKPVVLLRFTGAMVGDGTAREDTARVFKQLGGRLNATRGKERRVTAQRN